MNNNAMPVLLAAALAAVLLFAAAGSASAADQAVSPPKARVAGGMIVPMVNSSRTAQQWSAQRPGFRNLRPKVRSNVE